MIILPFLQDDLDSRLRKVDHGPDLLKCELYVLLALLNPNHISSHNRLGLRFASLASLG